MVFEIRIVHYDRESVRGRLLVSTIFSEMWVIR